LVKRVMSEAGVLGARACPRGLRHGFGVGALQSGIPVTLLQRWLGHARLTTTAIYVQASGPEEREIAKIFWEKG
jgi:site-specific recombinase XerD